jgi:hypothetical protein
MLLCVVDVLAACDYDFTTQGVPIEILSEGQGALCSSPESSLFLSRWPAYLRYVRGGSQK